MVEGISRYSAMTVKQLKDILSEKGAKRVGQKQDLVERLEA